jgi:ABC-type branched-subunit amino acid transport system substrate-binding protein
MRYGRAAAMLIVLALVAAACDRGQDPSNPAPAAAVPTSSVVADPTVPPVDTDTGVDDTTAPAPDAGVVETTAPPSDPGPGPGDFGSLVAVCGPNEGGGEIPDLGDDEIQGLSVDTIKLATIADPGFQGSPGLNQEIFDAGEAFAEWCNEAGGINGKQIDLTLRDAKLTNYQPVLEQACTEDFAVVGDGAVQDNLWADVGRACGLIDIAGFSVTAEKAGRAGDDPVSTRQVQPVPNPADEVAVGANVILQEEFPDTAASTGLIYADFQTLVNQYEKERAGFEEIGHVIIHTDVYNILGEDNWTPFAVSIRAAGVEFLRLIGEPDNGAQLKLALAEIGYSPAVTLQETNFYDPNYITAGGDAVEGDYIRTVFWPFEEADRNPATRAYLDILEAQGGKIATLGVQSMSAWLLFATLAKECDLENDLSRSCILERASQVTAWEGGGLHAASSPATNQGARCTIVLRIENGEFVRWAPEVDGGDGGYACDPAYVTPIETAG